MNNRIFVLSVLALLAVGTALLAPGAARAGDEGDAAGVWIYEVRVVRVDPAVPEVSETPSVLESATSTTVQLGWPEILAALKKRGHTTLLMDQRVTGLEGVKCFVNAERSVPILALNSQDKNNAQLRSATVKTGSKFEATTEAFLTYHLEVKWVLDAPGDERGPPQLTTNWSGTHPNLRGKTLVLAYREQVAQGPGQAARAVEIYGLVTGRFVATK